MTFSPSDIFQTGHKFFAGVIRRTSNTTWGILDTSDGHDDINLLAVTVSSSNLLVTWDFGTPSRVIWGAATPDEEYVSLGLSFGVAMNASNMGINTKMNTSGGNISCNGSNFVIDTPAFDISDDGGKNNLYDVTWNAGTSTCRVQWNGYNTDMQWKFDVEPIGRRYIARRVGQGTAGSYRAYVDIQFVDADSGNALVTSLNTDIKFSVYSSQPATVNPSKLVSANSNIWVAGIVKFV